MLCLLGLAEPLLANLIDQTTNNSTLLDSVSANFSPHTGICNNMMNFDSGMPTRRRGPRSRQRRSPFRSETRPRL